jgi:hypothetical protein
MPSKATTINEYLDSLPQDRRAALNAVRKVILKSLDKDYEEGIQYGAIGYYVPHRVHPAGYHCDPKQPLPFATLMSQKNHMALHLMGLYGDSDQAKWFRDAWAKSGKKLDMGKACLRFKKLDDLALDVIGEAIKRMPAKKYIARMTEMAGSRKTAKKSASKKGLASRSRRPRARRAVLPKHCSSRP